MPRLTPWGGGEQIGKGVGGETEGGRETYEGGDRGAREECAGRVGEHVYDLYKT